MLHERVFKVHSVLSLVIITNEENVDIVLTFVNSAMEVTAGVLRILADVCKMNSRQTDSSLSTLVAERSDYSMYLLKDIQYSTD